MVYKPKPHLEKSYSGLLIKLHILGKHPYHIVRNEIFTMHNIAHCEKSHDLQGFYFITSPKLIYFQNFNLSYLLLN